MKVYLQRPDGTELELVVMEPDPEDGTMTAFLDPADAAQVIMTSEDWIRIVPNE